MKEIVCIMDVKTTTHGRTLAKIVWQEFITLPLFSLYDYYIVLMISTDQMSIENRYEFKLLSF